MSGDAKDDRASKETIEDDLQNLVFLVGIR